MEGCKKLIMGHIFANISLESFSVNRQMALSLNFLNEFRNLIHDIKLTYNMKIEPHLNDIQEKVEISKANIERQSIENLVL